MYIKELIIRSENDVPKAIQQAVADRIDVVVGDVVSVRRAKEMGLGAILVTSGKEAISSSIFKALEIAAVRRQERIRCRAVQEHPELLATRASLDRPRRNHSGGEPRWGEDPRCQMRL